MTDRLDLTNAFEAAGIERKAAEHLAAEIFDAIRENVATKADLAELRAATKADLADLRAATKADLADLRAATKADTAELRTELKGDIAAVRTEIAASKAEILKWMFAQTLATIGGVAALIHLLH